MYCRPSLTELQGYRGEPLTVSDIPEERASRAVDAWLTHRGLKRLSKTAIAEHLLRVSHKSLAYVHWDPGGDAPVRLLRPARARTLTRLYERMSESVHLKE